MRHAVLGCARGAGIRVTEGLGAEFEKMAVALEMPHMASLGIWCAAQAVEATEVLQSGATRVDDT